MNKPVYKKWWFWAIMAFAVIGGISGGLKDREGTQTVAEVDSKQVSEAKTVQAPSPTEKVETAVSVPVPKKEAVSTTEEKAEKTEPTQEEWQASYKQILLNETSSYIELTVKGTLSFERHESAIKVLNKYSEKVAPSEKDNASKLAEAVEKDNLATAQKIYILMGGDDFPELHKK
ncbi:hypothetical protein [Paenibacillus polymyxa]|uniref:hypothetical protein n=1 Tax=Paenibacillus TaxID=44249 RepID=UPI002024C147|nr:hypothetical protein [Paenibacillus polymyxa]URJ42125.1 hypothetical protein MF627_001777 [Paenibacillus polymyxa]